MEAHLTGVKGWVPLDSVFGKGLSSDHAEEAVPGPSVFPSGDPGVSGYFWGSREGCQGPFRPSGRNRGLPLRRRRGPIFPSGCEGKLGVALESLQGRRDLT